MTRQEADAVLEVMAIDLVGALSKAPDSMYGVLEQRLEAVDMAQAALRKASEGNPRCSNAPTTDPARDMNPRKAYKLDGFWCKICRKQHIRVVEVDGIYLTREAAEEALEEIQDNGKE